MKNLVSTAIVIIAVTLSTGSFAAASAQQLQSDGTMSQPSQQSPQPVQQQQAAPAEGGMPRHAANPARQAKHLSKELGLSPDQSAQLQPILADRDSRMAALHADTTLDPRTMHQQSRAIGQDTDTRINALLTPAQQQLYADMKAAHHHRHGAPAGATAPTT